MTFHEVPGTEFSMVDSLNIPLDIWLVEETGGDDLKKTGRWELRAVMYQPKRDNHVEQDDDCVFRAVADSREELVPLVREHIIPIYQKALAKLEAICTGDNDSLYHWD